MIGRAPLRAPNRYPIVGSRAGSGKPHGTEKVPPPNVDSRLTPVPRLPWGFDTKHMAPLGAEGEERESRGGTALGHPHGSGWVWHRNRCQNHPKGMRIMSETSAPCAPNPYEGLATRRGAGGLQGGLPNLISSPHPLLLSDLRGSGHHRVACHQTRLPSSLVHSWRPNPLPNISKTRVTPLNESRAVLTSR